VPRHLSRILQNAAIKAMPALQDQMAVTQAKEADDFAYASPTVIKLFNMHKKSGSFGFASCFDMATAIVQNVDPENDAIEKIDLAQMGKGPVDKSGFFLNIYLRQSFIEHHVRQIYNKA
jgi:hypothetical protein